MKWFKPMRSSQCNKNGSVAERGFCYVAVQCWKVLPHYIHIGSNLQEFDKLSKTYFCNIVYHEYVISTC